jgi:hypothetical protein
MFSKLLRGLASVGGLMLVLTACATPALGFDSFPEIDPSTMGSAVTLLIGGLLLLGSKRPR